VVKKPLLPHAELKSYIF
jgi:hypothetical protein